MPDLDFYKEHNAEICPYCKKGKVIPDYRFIQRHKNMLLIEVQCDQCGKKFDEFYKLAALGAERTEG